MHKLAIVLTVNKQLSVPIMPNSKLSLNAKLKIAKAQAAAEEAAKPKRIVSEERARLLRKLSYDLRNARVNSKTWHAINDQLRTVQLEEMALDEAFKLAHG